MRSPRLRGSPALELIPLGGLGEFGLNMMILRLGEDALIIDSGLLFPNEETPGVQLMMPDTSYLEEEELHIAGLVLTHGHEDHIGALPYLLAENALPPLTIYGTPLTLAMARARLGERGVLDRVDLQPRQPGAAFGVGPFSVEFVRVAHSLADAVALVIGTPYGNLVHTGDFKIDATPVVGEPTDVRRFREVGEQGVLCLLSDSTNSDVPGTTQSEKDVEETLASLIDSAPHRVLISCFSSSTHRVQLALELAHRHQRKLVILGRSMSDNFQHAVDHGFLDVPRELVVEPNELDKFPRERQLILCAGSQGEQASALSQIAQDNHRHIRIESGDRVIISARVIPGNEVAVSRVINQLYRLGADVHYRTQQPTHVSGHGSAEDLQTMLKLTKPEHFVPIHGEWRQLFHHAQLARESGLDHSRVFLAEDGDVIAFNPDGASMSDRVTVGRRCLDASGLGIIDECALRDRRRLSVSGVVVPMLALGKNRGSDISDILSHGFIENEMSDALLNEAHDAMLSAIGMLSTELRSDVHALEETLHGTLNRFFRKRTSRRPVIVPVVVDAEPS